ncbi:hypothetical protein G6F33_004902 [Rhizopus arrhizus]|jgi:thiaminase|uniref:Thiaminase-2/PQQC domain-containing protein n=1 Tax=Rhizopus oryzae TaxID=64495 RepID=A0A9P6XL95_RHIOR|nr:hypothetical protein G6F24_008008 [Rhizopus arrhizus]KAG0913716.1 hypothetical protein G6F33_004902 [Rhizopus arrhizus]KAG0958673.1 hypothetical protein G6F32_000110 [Rhizopus arrhizus]KAG1300301.1 hypothetical protein G6F66_000067 [Rhizopus arrhizus]KAG1316218.1 hypothetical protein G6F64_000031 [Rhizopus arrhizus]
MKLTDHLLSLNKSEFEKATQHPFLTQVGTLEIKPEHLKSWLIQDRYYTGGYIKMMGIMISRLPLYQEQRELGDNDASYTPERAQRIIKTLSFALSNVHRESNFFTDLLSRSPYAAQGSFEQKEWTTRYVDFHKKVAYESGYDLGEALVVLWAMEFVFYTAWSHAKTINAGRGKDSEEVHVKTCHELMTNWTLEEFKEFVDDCGSLVNELVFDDPKRLASFEKVYKDTLALEVKFWDMAYD